jgi:Fas-binding factor 1
MNLDLDDPLGDLLSDGSNDSFFGVEPAKKAVPKIEQKDKKPAGAKMEQLFGISEEKSEPMKPKTSELKLFSNSELASPFPNLPKRPTTAAVDSQKLQPSKYSQPEQSETKSNDSLSSDFGFDPKKPRKKGNILDELLGIGESSLTSTSKSQLPTKPLARENPSSSAKASISRQTTSETISENVNVENPSATRKAGRRQSAVVFSDPLGLFGPNEKEKEQIKKAQAKTARKSIAGSEWLFNDPTQEKSSVPFTKLKSSPAIQITPNSEETHDDEPASNVTSLESKNTLTNIPPSNPPRNLPQLTESLVSETTNTLNNLKQKQQEFQLMVATQMKTQEHHFNELLKNQRQSELDEIIKNHMQASHAQAQFMDNYVMSSNSAKTIGEGHATDNSNPLEKVELEADVKRLEMEKLRLEDLLSNISDNHEKEIVMIEKSYKKRIQLMEENLESMEHRFKNEIATIETFFTDKIKSISDERKSNLETLKLHYEEMMQNIRRSKFMEFAIKEESSSYADILKRASSHLETASGDIHSLHEVLQEKLIVLERDKEIQLSSREKRLDGMYDVVFKFS